MKPSDDAGSIGFATPDCIPFDIRVIGFALRKLLQGLLMLFVVSVITFGMLSAAGGDAFTVLAENPQVSQETIERLRTVYGLDKPVAVRYFYWLGGLLGGDLGESFVYRTPVLGLVLDRLFDTVLLALSALTIALLIAIPAAYLIQRSRLKWLEALADIVVSIAASTPRIVGALFALLLIVSLSGTATVTGSSIVVLLLGSFVLSLPLIAGLLAQAKGELARAGSLAFVQFARAKGLPERSVILRHAIREALNPIFTLVGLSFGSLIGGSVVVETILGWQGVGALAVAAVRGRDIPLVMGIVMVTSIAVWFGNLLAELLQMLNDPRLRAAETATEI